MDKIEITNSSKFIKELEDLIEKVKAGEVEDCDIKVLLKKEEDVPVHPECNGDCENCENYVEEENDPEEVFEDLSRTIGCLIYYDLPIPMLLVSKYNLALLEARGEDDADSEDS